MSERDQAKDADLAARSQAEAAQQQQDQEAQAAGGLFGMPAMMQALELSGDVPGGSDVWNAETAQSADLLAHGGWSEVAEASSGGGGADEGEGGRLDAVADAAVEGEDRAAERAAADAAEAQLRAAIAAAQATIDAAAEAARAAIDARTVETRGGLAVRHGQAIAELGRAARSHGRTLVGALTMAGRIGDDGREDIERAVRRARAEIDDAADSGSHALAAMGALHADRLRREAGRAGEPEGGPGRLAGAVRAALAAVKRTVDAAVRRMTDARQAAGADLAEALNRAGDRLQRLVVDVRYAIPSDGSGG